MKQQEAARLQSKQSVTSTMYLHVTEYPTPDERPPLDMEFWAQYVLDNCSTLEEVFATDAEVRIRPGHPLEHYLVCDRYNECAVIEFIEGEMIYHTGESLPMPVLTNDTYERSLPR